MAISISFFLVYSRKKIQSDRLYDTPVSIRAQVRYTRSHLNWSAARRFGHEIRRIQFTTGVQAHPRLWANGKVKHTHPNAATINATLDAIAERAIEAHAAYIEAGIFPPDNDFMAAMLGAKEAAGVPRGVIMRITGHRTERQYLRYTGITYRVNADLMRRANPDMFKTAG